jgi:hypothetical protein
VKIVLCSLIACCFATLTQLSFAAIHYVRAGASGNGSGTDWTNAHYTLPSTLIRGDTYYIADGVYGSYAFNDPTSGSSYINIRKATAADHGTETGWIAGFGDGEALFTGPSPVWSFSAGYYDIDGVVGSGKAVTPYGFRVMPTTSRCVNEFSSAVMFTSRANITNLAWRHIDFEWNNGTPSCASAVPALFYTQDASSDYVTIENSYFHHAPGFAFYIGPYDPNLGGVPENHYTIRNNYFYMLGGGGSADHHWEAMWLMNLDNSDIYNNIVEDIVGESGQTGWMMIAKANNLNIYGNVFYCTSANCIVGGNGVIATWSLDVYRNDSVRIYNNTFANLKGVFNDFGIRFTHNTVSDTNIIVRNNLYCSARFSWSGVTSQSHESCGCGQPCSGTNQQTSITTTQFKNYAGGDFRLTSSTAAGDLTIGQQFNHDMTGTLRGGDGTWDRGAFEYNASSLTAPTNLRVIQ